MRKALLLASLAIVSSAPAIAQTCPVRAARFDDSLGVNTHFSDWTAYTAPKVGAEMNYVGFHNIRDSIPPQRTDVESEFETLGKQGIKFTILQSANNDSTVNLSGDMAMLVKLNTAVPGTAISYEGANEYNSYLYILNGQPSQGNVGWGIMDNWVSMVAMEQSAATAGMTYVAASTGGLGSIPSLQASANYANYHIYGPNGAQLGPYLQSGIATAQAALPGGGVEITETGISSVPFAYTTWGTAGDEKTQATIDTNAVLEGFIHGAYRTFLYDLQSGDDPTNKEQQLGLFRSNGASKPVADYLHNLTSILADSGASAAWFQTTPLPLSVSGLPPGGRSLLLQKSNGNYELVLWNPTATVWAGNAEAYVPLSILNIQFGSVFTTVNLYSVAQGTTPAARLGTSSSLSVGLGKDALIIELSDRWTPASSTCSQ